MAVVIAAGLTIFFLVRDSQNELIGKSIEKIIEANVENLATTLDYMVKDELRSGTEILVGIDDQQLIADIVQ